MCRTIWLQLLAYVVSFKLSEFIGYFDTLGWFTFTLSHHKKCSCNYLK